MVSVAAVIKVVLMKELLDSELIEIVLEGMHCGDGRKVSCISMDCSLYQSNA